MTIHNLWHGRPSARPAAAAFDNDDDDEDAPAVVGGIEDDAADLKYEGLRSAFPMAFGMPIPYMSPCMQTTKRCAALDCMQAQH